MAITFTLPTFATNMAGENHSEKPLVEKYNAYKASKVYEFSVKAGFNIGGTSPMGLPAEIRQNQLLRPNTFTLDRWRCHSLVYTQMGV